MPDRRVYVASKARHWVWWAALRAAGVPIVAPWIDAMTEQLRLQALIVDKATGPPGAAAGDDLLSRV
jgi:hypothetical protein